MIVATTVITQDWQEWMEEAEADEDTNLGEGFASSVGEWIENGFSLDESFAWISAGVFCADAAKELENEKIDPDEVEEQSPSCEGFGEYSATYGYKIANGDLRIEEFKRIKSA
jgi:hypothetical protein